MCGLQRLTIDILKREINFTVYKLFVFLLLVLLHVSQINTIQTVKLTRTKIFQALCILLKSYLLLLHYTLPEHIRGSLALDRLESHGGSGKDACGKRICSRQS